MGLSLFRRFSSGVSVAVGRLTRVQLIGELLTAGADVNAVHRRGQGAVMAACDNVLLYNPFLGTDSTDNGSQVVSVLLDACANVNAADVTQDAPVRHQLKWG